MMPTRNINLTEHYDRFIQEQLESGRFQNASEVMRAGLSLLEQKQREDALKIEYLKREVQKGLDDYEARRCTSVRNQSEHIIRS